MRRMEIHFMDMILVCALLVLNHANRAASEHTRGQNDSSGNFSIKEFVNTNMPIWTILTTANDSLKCKVDQKDSMINGNLYFSRKGRTRTAVVIEKLRGNFSSRNAMFVGPKSGGSNEVEVLIYQEEPWKSCGVFEIRNTSANANSSYYFNGKPNSHYHAYDIRVGGYGGERSADPCLKWFETVFPNETSMKRLYTPDCKSIARMRWFG
uniref:Putative group i salivary lipocalin n=1 Tax=Rhipicephalus pulchellus TaxID=72859 RepID=L7LPZ8_RHIPC